MKDRITWYSPRLQQDVTCVRFGLYGQPVLLFPTAGGDAEECERWLMVNALKPLINAGRIKLYSCDSVAGRLWVDGSTSGGHRAFVQDRFDAYVAEELVPHIHRDCRTPGIPIMVTGASIGAYNALASICRHPDLFSTAICMSGSYDLKRWMGGEHTRHFHLISPLHFIPFLGEDSRQLALLRERLVVLATGEGRWEAPGESWAVANTLGRRGIPNRVDLWGTQWDHDWITWRAMLPLYLDTMVPKAA